MNQPREVSSTSHYLVGLKGPTTDHGEILAWANLSGIVPVNVEPNRVDAEPAAMALLHKMTANETSQVKEMTWEDFFERFDALGLSLVYDDRTAFNEILQIEEQDANVPEPYRRVTPHH